MALQKRIKIKGDNILIDAYGKAFFTKHVSWNIGTSYIYNAKESKSWTDRIKDNPETFLLRYNIHLDGKTYYGIIKFELDRKGTLMLSEGEKIYGFERLPKKSPRVFTITTEKAITVLRQKGLYDSNSIKPQAYLRWEKDSDTSYTGKFLFYIVKKTSTSKDIQPTGRSTIIDRYTVHVFNPWTSAFTETKKMKAIRSQEERSGNTTGLLPDN